MCGTSHANTVLECIPVRWRLLAFDSIRHQVNSVHGSVEWIDSLTLLLWNYWVTPWKRSVRMIGG